MNWAQFFKFRQSRLRWERFGGVLGGSAAFAGTGGYLLFVKDFDPLEPAPFGLPDISIAYIIATCLAGFSGFMVGTMAAIPMWRMLKTKYTASKQDKPSPRWI